MDPAGSTADARPLSRRQFIHAGGAVVFGGAVFAACGDSGGGGAASGGGAGGSKKIGFAMSTFDVPRYSKVDLPAFEAAVKAAGYEPTSNQANDDAQQQSNNVDNLLSLGLGALVILPVVGDAAKSMVRKANTEDVPVLAYNTGIPSGQISGFVSRDNIAVGESIANSALEDQGLTGNWVVVSGEAGNAVAEDCTKGIFNIIQPRVDAGDMKVVDHQFHKAWDPELARRQAEDALTKHENDIAGFLCNSDGLAIGVLAALEAQGRAGQSWLGAQDASEPACRAIVAGTMNMSSFTKFDEMGKTAGELAVRLAKGEEPTSDATYDTGEGEVPLFVIESYPVTRDNVVEFLTSYSPHYVDAKAVFRGIPKAKWPEGAEELLAS
jgi:ABC-type xylose transport system substrate-binding protein